MRDGSLRSTRSRAFWLWPAPTRLQTRTDFIVTNRSDGGHGATSSDDGDDDNDNDNDNDGNADGSSSEPSFGHRPHVLLPDSCGYALAENLQSMFCFKPALFAVQSVGEGREHGCVMT